jgi:ABC-type branched-subunit amino acid transport system substrate-binding protein
VQDAIYFQTKAFNDTPIDGCVAAHTNAACNAVAQIFNGFKGVQVAYGCTGSYLSYATPYPYFMRTCSDDAFQSIAMADIIANHFQWKYVSLFASADSYGSDGSTQFQLGATQNGINVVSIHQFLPGTIDLSPLIKDALTRGTRIFVFYCSSYDAARLLELGRKMGLFVQGTLVLGSSAVVNPAIYGYFSAGAPVQGMLARSAVGMFL